jgi:hypothetical protein
MISHLVRASVLAAICATSAATAAPARTPYDGSWTLLIVTQSGACDRAFRYGVQIVDGIVRYDGGAVTFSGQVARNGDVRVTVSAGGGRAEGTGRFSRNSGQGKWIGRASSGACSGYWEAERR